MIVVSRGCEKCSSVGCSQLTVLGIQKSVKVTAEETVCSMYAKRNFCSAGDTKMLTVHYFGDSEWGSR